MGSRALSARSEEEVDRKGKKKELEKNRSKRKGEHKVKDTE